MWVQTAPVDVVQRSAGTVVLMKSIALLLLLTVPLLQSEAGFCLLNNYNFCPDMEEINKYELVVLSLYYWRSMIKDGM